MPRKKHPETPEEQAKRFESEAQKLVDAGLLDSKKAADCLDRLVRKSAKEG